jgi:hypothetical protein
MVEEEFLAADAPEVLDRLAATGFWLRQEGAGLFLFARRGVAREGGEVNLPTIFSSGAFAASSCRSGCSSP